MSLNGAVQYTYGLLEGDERSGPVNLWFTEMSLDRAVQYTYGLLEGGDRSGLVNLWFTERKGIIRWASFQ